MTITWRGARYTVGAACALWAVYASVVNVEWPQVTAAFRSASPLWTAIATVSVLFTLLLVTRRWDVLVGDEPTRRTAASTRRRVLWDAVVLGQAVNILIPVRLGEGARLAVTSRGLSVPVGRLLVGLAIERAFDIAAFVTIIAVLLAAGWMPEALRGLQPAAIAITLGMLAAAIGIGRFLPRILSWIRTRLRILAPAAAWIASQESAMHQGWNEITRRHQLAHTAVLTILIPVTAAATNMLVFKGFDLPVPVVTSFALLVVLQLGTSVVSVPGNVGVFHYLTVVTLTAWHVPPSTALATAIVLHFVSLGPKVVLAAFAARSRL